jgi:PKD repeat protein
VNTAPTVNAGSDSTITLPVNSVSLVGTASDDGLPSGGVLSYQWTAPAGVTFSNPNSLITTATFTGTGTYNLTLTVSDGALSTSDSLIVTVNPAPTNRPPTVNAGPDITSKMPPNFVRLSGTASDDGLPNGSLTYRWTAPAGVKVADPGSLNTKATFSAPGAYTITLTVSDGTLSSSDSLVVTLNSR